MSNSREERAADGALARLWAKEGTHLLMVIAGVLVSLAWNGLRGDISDLKAAQAKQGENMAKIQSDVRSINDRLDAGLVRQIGELTNSRDDHERRIQALERVTPVK